MFWAPPPQHGDVFWIRFRGRSFNPSENPSKTAEEEGRKEKKNIQNGERDGGGRSTQML